MRVFKAPTHHCCLQPQRHTKHISPRTASGLDWSHFLPVLSSKLAYESQSRHRIGYRPCGPAALHAYHSHLFLTCHYLDISEAGQYLLLISLHHRTRAPPLAPDRSGSNSIRIRPAAGGAARRGCRDPHPFRVRSAKPLPDRPRLRVQAPPENTVFV